MNDGYFQSGMSLLQTTNGLGGWSGEGDGKTNFKTSVWIEDANGKKIATSELSPMPIWDIIPPNCKVIKYERKLSAMVKPKATSFI